MKILKNVLFHSFILFIIYIDIYNIADAYNKSNTGILGIRLSLTAILISAYLYYLYTIYKYKKNK